MRDYDPSLGRYIQADPLGLIGGLNLYGYANQNPILYTDPKGEQAAPVGVLMLGGGLRCLSNPVCRALLATAIGSPTGVVSVRVLRDYMGMSPSDEAKEEVGNTENMCIASSPQQPENDNKKCDKIIKQCKEQCANIFAENPDSLPGSGGDYFSRQRRCIRQCAEEQGCPNY